VSKVRIVYIAYQWSGRGGTDTQTPDNKKSREQRSRQQVADGNVPANHIHNATQIWMQAHVLSMLTIPGNHLMGDEDDACWLWLLFQIAKAALRLFRGWKQKIPKT
jgi:hypothetical protein